jgi:hypothetical protein
VSTIKDDEMAGDESHMGKMKNAYIILVWKPEGMSPLWKSRIRQEDNIKMHLKEIGCEFVDWVYLVQGSIHLCAIVNMVMNIYVPLKVEIFLNN